MGTEYNEIQKKESTSGSADLEKLLEERGRLDELIQRKFTKTITIMFTDMKGSSSIAEIEGDVVSRFLIKKHNDILFPIIKEQRGELVKTMGDGTLSYFETAGDAVSAAVKIQASINTFNHLRPTKTALQVRIGLNTGTGIVEKNDIFGDVVNVASRFQTLALPGEIYISENTYDALVDKSEFYCKHIKTTKLKGVREIYKVFKVFWDQDEIDRDRSSSISTVEESDEKDRTVSLEEFAKMGSTIEKDTGEKETVALYKAKNLERDNEFIELYFYCQAFKAKEMQDIYLNLKSQLESSDRIETKFNGENAIWFFRENIIMGRIPEADVPITNKAISRVPIKIGIKNGEGFLEIESRGTSVKSVELEKPSRKEIVKADTEYLMGKSGKVIFSICFPLEYNVYRDRFLVLRILNPEECIKQHYHFQLRDIWKDFEHESEKLIVIGV
jgi:class 3 adenylate cyclase